MKVIRINAKVFIAAITIMLAGSFGFSIYNYKSNLELQEKYELMTLSAFNYDSSGLLGFLASAASIAQEDNDVEIFDIDKGEVIKKVRSSSFIQGEAEKYILGITNIYTRVKAFPDRGRIVKIPLNPPLKVNTKWLERVVDKVFIIFPENAEPYLLILDEKERPLFYTFDVNTKALIDYLNSSK